MTIQESLKELFYSLGGDADKVRETEDVNEILAAISALMLGQAIAKAAELPELPEDDGTYSLQLVMADGEATLTWEAVE